MNSELLGLPLADALTRLRAQGIEPAVLVSRAPRRAEGQGAPRVVRVQQDGRVLTICAFMDLVSEALHG
ncbi:MAG: hypothetical protein LBM74_09270 [Oscillospiraceae bacterium]|nr:hypothetical protein [Oscillospiraceae bacterium]